KSERGCPADTSQLYSRLMTELIQVNNQLKKQFKDVNIQLQNYFEQIQKKLDQDIKILENMTHQLQNKEYLALKSQIHILKQFYSKEKESCKQQQIIEFNNILNTLKKMLTDQIRVEEQIDSSYQNDIKVEQINQLKQEDKNQLNFEEAKRLLIEGVALRKLNKYQEAIECYDKAISINPNYDDAWYNKGLALYNLNKYQEAIECYDKAISINPKYDAAWNNKGNSLYDLKKYQEAIECYDKAISINPKYDAAWNNKGLALYDLKKYQEAIECYDKAISINPNNDNALSNKGLSLHSLKKYQDAITCYDQALSICINPVRLRDKGISFKFNFYLADSLFELQLRQEAKRFYLDALRQGSNDKEYINRQLAKL
ncbi:unnamed protein product, partial (macronuclear) [Paramecium tetraurelia]